MHEPRLIIQERIVHSDSATHHIALHRIKIRSNSRTWHIRTVPIFCSTLIRIQQNESVSWLYIVTITASATQTLPKHDDFGLPPPMKCLCLTRLHKWESDKNTVRRSWKVLKSYSSYLFSLKYILNLTSLKWRDSYFTERCCLIQSYIFSIGVNSAIPAVLFILIKNLSFNPKRYNSCV